MIYIKLTGHLVQYAHFNIDRAVVPRDMLHFTIITGGASSTHFTSVSYYTMITTVW